MPLLNNNIGYQSEDRHKSMQKPHINNSVPRQAAEPPGFNMR